jgi:two-component system LytT family response regulator
MSAIRTVIVDDEELCRRGVRLLLSAQGGFDVVAECADGKDAIAKIKELKPDLLFLDIRMPEVSGFDVLRAFAEEELPFVIFVTAYDEYAVHAFEVHALDYVLKPFSKKRFRAALERARQMLRERELRAYSKSLWGLLEQVRQRGEGRIEEEAGRAADALERILIKEKDSYKFVRIEEVDWIEGADYYIQIHAGGRSYLHRWSLKAIESKLPADSFVRIHKSAIVNMNKVREIKIDFKNDLSVCLEGGRQLKVSRRKKKELLELWERRYGLGS